MREQSVTAAKERLKCMIHYENNILDEETMGYIRRDIGNVITKYVDVEPENIVAITYTEKAASSLKQKIFDAYEKEHKTLEGLANMYIGTIHGFCLYMLQEFSDEYKTFETLNEVQTKLFIKQQRKFNGIYDAMYHSAKGDIYNLATENSRSDTLAKAINE